MYYLSVTPFNNMTNYEGTVSIVGRITDDIADYGYYKTLTLDDVKINGESTNNVYIAITNCEELEIGKVIAFESVATKEPLFEFGSFRSDYVRNNVVYYSSVDYQDISFFPGEMKFDEKVRAKIKETLLSGMSEENAYIAYAVLTGEKSGIDGEIYNNYKSAGIVHLLCVSGLHVGILAGFIAYILKLCKANKWLRFGLTAVILLFYMYICGFAPSVVRASIMSLVFLLSFIFGRQNDSLSSVALAGIIICCVSPLFAFDAGFLMSFFCIIVINLLYRPINKILIKALPKWASSYLSLSICASLATLPFLASFYSSFNFLSLFANLIVVPLFSVIFIVLFMLTLISIIMYFMSPLLIVVDYAFTALNWIAKFYNTPVLSLPMSPLNPEITAFAFLALYCFSNFLMLGFKPRMMIVCVFTCLFVICSALSFIPIRNTESEVHYTCSSYESSLLLRSKSGKTMMIGLTNKVMLKEHLDYVKVKNIDYCISAYAHKKDTLEFLKSRNLTSSYVYEEGEETGEILLPKNSEVSIGDFTVQIHEKEGISLGTSISFDDVSIFFAFTEKLSYNESEFIANNVNEVDFLFAEYNTQIMSYISSNVKITRPYVSNADYSYSGFGNMILTKTADNLKIRSLD